MSNMYSSTLIKCLSLLVCANGQLLDTPAVDELVSSALSPFEQYTSTEALPEIVTSAAKIQTSVTKIQAAVSGAAAADTAYWLADIAHQGVAAFNPNPSGYGVFRNVKDYGAKGEFSVAWATGKNTKKQAMV